MKTIEEFSGQEVGYQRAITLRNSLIPIGKTEEHFKATDFLEKDKERANAYVEVKTLIDDFHKRFIDDSLHNISLNWKPLAKALETYQEETRKAKSKKKDKDIKENTTQDNVAKKALENEQQKMRKEVVTQFTKNNHYELLFKKDLFEKLLPELIKNDDSGIISEKQSALSKFKNFTTYFTGFHENRKNLYSADNHTTAISNRLVHENFPKFCSNISLFNYLKKEYPNIISATKKSLKVFLGKEKLEDVFTVNAFNSVCTQKGIDFYNTIIGGISDKAGTEKTKGLNEFINLTRQQLPKEEQHKLNKKMVSLFKQILSDSVTASFIPEQFKTDDAVYNEIQNFHENSLSPIIPTIKNLYENYKNYDLSKIFVPQKKLTAFSLALYGKWNIIENAIHEYCVDQIDESKSSRGSRDNKIEKLKKEITKNPISLEFINELYNLYAKKYATEQINIIEYFSLEENREKNKDKNSSDEIGFEKIPYIDTINNMYKKIDFTTKLELTENKENAIPLKSYLDAIQNLYHYLILVDFKGDEEYDSSFYSDYYTCLTQISPIISLYNQVRNYVTKKPGEVKKVRMFFNSPTLANGWDKNKEDANKAIILIKDNEYYLGIMKPGEKINFEQEFKIDDEKYYEKMVYKLLPGPNKMFPKVFFSEKGKANFKPSEKLLKQYAEKKHIKSDENFDIHFCHELIDWFKNAVNQHEDWKNFNFKFSPTKSYEDISKFYREVTEQGYKLTFDKIPDTFINDLVEDGKLFLFQIYNKDFAKERTGRENLHTMYWKSLFSPENLENIVYKLNGEAELFFRPSSAKKVITHPKGSILLNKTMKDGNPVPNKLYLELYHYLNGKGKLSSEGQALYDSDLLIKKEAKFDIVKDRRFSKDSYLFHCPITMNFKDSGINTIAFNTKVRQAIAEDSSIKIIGIDRGERHLLYLTLINQKGEIELQKTLNLVEQVRSDKTVSIDYQQKLVEKEGNRDEARKNWQTIETIKELKEGYLSLVVHEIAQLMVKENAIVVLEDLNFGFKRGRFAVERQVYQKFEKMLIEKLNYLVFKEQNIKEPGGLLKAYQLTAPFESFEKLGKQSGWLFYVPAMYTSKIDPTTGFINAFNLKGLTNIGKKKEFFEKFDSIRFDKSEGCFIFSFDYKEFDKNISLHRTKWEIHTHGTRLVYQKKYRSTAEVSPTEILKEAFDSKNIEWKNGNELLEEIKAIEATRENFSFFDDMYNAFKHTLQMRNSKPNSNDDWIMSPIKSTDGTFFDSREQIGIREKGSIPKLPENADANGAYHIAMKGLLMLQKKLTEPTKNIAPITNAEWLEFMQTRGIKK